MATAQEILDNLKNALGTTDAMIGDFSAGVSNTDVSNLQGGALGGLVNQLVPERKPIDPALLALIGFSRMAEASSKPGATGLGAFGSGITAGAGAYLKDKQLQEASDAKRTSTLVTLASTLGKGKSEKLYTFTKPTIIDGVSYEKGATKFFTNSELNKLDDNTKSGIVTYTAPATEIKTYKGEFDGNLYYKNGEHAGKRVEDNNGNFIDYNKSTESSIGDDTQKVSRFEKKEDEQKPAFAPLNMKQQDNFLKVKDKYKTSKFVKDYNDKLGHMDNVFTSYDQVYKLDRPGAGDLALIFSFMKMLDPRSVVREGEFDVAKKVGGPADFLVQTANYIKNGGILSDLTRRSFRDMAYAQYKNATVNLKTQNEEEIKTGDVLRLEENVIKTYLKEPKQYTFDTDTYKIILPKKQNIKGLKEFFLTNGYSVDDIQYMVGGENVKNNESLKKTIRDILKDVKEKSFILKPRVR